LEDSSHSSTQKSALNSKFSLKSESAQTVFLIYAQTRAFDEDQARAFALAQTLNLVLHRDLL